MYASVSVMMRDFRLPAIHPIQVTTDQIEGDGVSLSIEENPIQHLHRLARVVILSESVAVRSISRHKSSMPFSIRVPAPYSMLLNSVAQCSSIT